MTWYMHIFLFWRPYWPPSWIVTFRYYCHYAKSICWPWKHYIRHFICYYSLPLTWYIHICVCWRPYWTPSWIVTFGHYCHYDKSIPWPWKYYIRHFICYCSLPLTWNIHIFCVLAAILDAILDSNIRTLLPLRYIDSLILKILYSTLHLLL